MRGSRNGARRPRRSRGFSLLETVLSMGIAASALGGFMQMQGDASERTRALAAAARVTQIAAAAGDYVKVYGAQLMTAIPPGGATVIPVALTVAGGAVPTGPYGLPSLQGGAFLPSNFVDTNGYAQNTAVIVRNVAASGVTPAHLEALVTTYGGQPIRDAYLSVASGKIGAAGGMVMTKPPPNTAADTVQGSFGGWQSPAAAWAAGMQTPAVGHVQASLAFSNQGTGLSDYLDRYSTGVPEANRMHTNIDNNGQSLNNLKGIGGGTNGTLTVGNYDTSGNLTSSSDVAVTGTATVGGGTASTDCNGPCGLTVTGGVELKSDWLRIVGSGKIYWQSWGGGLYMADATWIRTYNDAGLYTGLGQILSETNVTSHGNMQSPVYYDYNNTGYYLIPSNWSNLNAVEASYIASGDSSMSAWGFDGDNLVINDGAGIGGNLNVGGTVGVLGSLGVGGYGYIGGDFAAQGDAYISGNFGVAQSANILGTLGIGQNLEVAGAAGVQQYVWAGTTVTGSQGVQTGLTASPGGGCQSGMMAMSSVNGSLLFCQMGVWTAAQHQYAVTAASNVAGGVNGPPPVPGCWAGWTLVNYTPFSSNGFWSSVGLCEQ